MMSTDAGMAEQTSGNTLEPRASVLNAGRAVHDKPATNTRRTLSQNGIQKKALDIPSRDPSSDAALHACSKCSATFTRIAHLRRHENSIHNFNNPKHHGCGGCGKEMSRRLGNDQFFTLPFANTE
jgi:uncharacterized Zn-finger protein